MAGPSPARAPWGQPPRLSSQNIPATSPRPGWCITSDATGGSTARVCVDVPLSHPTAPRHRTRAGQGELSDVTTCPASLFGTGNLPAGEVIHDLGQKNFKKRKKNPNDPTGGTAGTEPLFGERAHPPWQWVAVQRCPQPRPWGREPAQPGHDGGTGTPPAPARVSRCIAASPSRTAPTTNGWFAALPPPPAHGSPTQRQPSPLPHTPLGTEEMGRAWKGGTGHPPHPEQRRDRGQPGSGAVGTAPTHRPQPSRTTPEGRNS